MMVILQEEPKLYQEGDESSGGVNGQVNSNILSIRNMVELMRKVEEVLKALKIMSKCNTFFKDIGNYKTDDFYERNLALIVGLNDSTNELLAYLSTNLIKAIIQFDGLFIDKKNELLNKSLIINKKPILLKKLVESMAYKTLFGSKNQESHFSLSLKSTLELFESLFITHKDSTSPEDLTLIYKVLTSKILIAATSNLCRCESFALLYKSTCIFNHLFKISSNIRSSYKELQSMFMNNTCLILLHMFHGISNISQVQRKESVIFFSHMLDDNQMACSLLIRLIPKCLLSRISTTQSDISKWGNAHWEEFFGILKQTFNTPTEQWNDACRKELLMKLKKADEEYFRKRRDITEKEIALNNNDINIPESKLLSLKWNHEEFIIEYEALKPKFLIWKYYLSCLIRDREESMLTISISQPLRLWNELNYSFMSSLNIAEREKILKAMILLYRFHFHSIREINAIPYWVNLLRNELFSSHNYLILQLLYCSFTRNENSINKLNIKKLYESQGVDVLFELLSGLHYENDENIKKYEHPIHNFTEAKFLSYSADCAISEKINSVLYILNMLMILLNKQKPLDEFDREVYPHPYIKSSCLKEPHLEILINCLLMSNEDINNMVFRILKEFFVDRICYMHLIKVNAFFEILLSKITKNTIRDIMELVIILYQRVCEDPEMPNYINVYLSFEFDVLDQQVIEESLDFFRFLKFFPKNLIWRLFNQGFDEFSKIFFEDNFEEPSLIWNKSMREKVFRLINEHLEPFHLALLDYSMRNKVFRLEQLPRFNNTIPGEILHDNIENEVRCGPLFLRIWNLKSQKHFYIEEDMINRFLLLLGEILSNVISGKSDKEFQESVDMDDLLILLHSHSKAIKRYEIHQYTSFAEVIMVLNYFANCYSNIVYKKANTPFSSPSKEIPENINNLNVDITSFSSNIIIKFLNHGLRLIYRAIKIPNSGNLENFIENKGFSCIFLNLKALVSKIFLRKKTPEHIYYYNNMNINAKDLGSLCLAIKILKYFLQNVRHEISDLENSELLELCHILQKISKIPLVYFEFLKYRKRKKNFQNNENIEKAEKDVDLDDKNLFEDLIIDQDEVKMDNNPIETYEKKVFFLMSDIAMIWVNFSTDVSILDSLIKAGVLWRCIEISMLYEENFEMGGFDFEKTQKINEICEDCVLIIRNVTIFSNEIFILKNTSYSDAPFSEKITASKQKSEVLFNEISKLNKKKKDVLKAYFEGLQTLILRKSIQGLLEDYYEALEKPEEKDKRGIKKFLKLINNDLEEEGYIWTMENREDLKEIIKIQVSVINEDPNK